MEFNKNKIKKAAFFTVAAVSIATVGYFLSKEYVRSVRLDVEKEMIEKVVQNSNLDSSKKEESSIKKEMELTLKPKYALAGQKEEDVARNRQDKRKSDSPVSEQIIDLVLKDGKRCSVRSINYSESRVRDEGAEIKEKDFRIISCDGLETAVLP